MTALVKSRTGLGFEWFVAWRHLRDLRKRPRWVLVAGLAISALALIALGARGGSAAGAARPLARGPRGRRSSWTTCGWPASSRSGSGPRSPSSAILVNRFTLFTAISIMGVYMGTAAPILALSVMSGFEADLKAKIRGAKADVVITTQENKPFKDWKRARELHQPGARRGRVDPLHRERGHAAGRRTRRPGCSCAASIPRAPPGSSTSSARSRRARSRISRTPSA